MKRFAFALVLALGACADSPTAPAVEFKYDPRVYIVVVDSPAIDGPMIHPPRNP